MTQEIKQTTGTLQKPVVCKKCRTTHFSYSLSCKRCGEYFNADDVQEPEKSSGSMKFMIAVAAAAAVVAAGFVFHIF